MLTKVTGVLIMSTMLLTSSMPTSFEKANSLLSDNKTIQIDELKIEIDKYKSPLGARIEKALKDKIQENIRIEQERIKKEQNEKQTKLNEYIKNNTYEFEMTFYTDLDIENGFGSITCEGKPLISGMVANNIMDLGTKILTSEFGELIVADRGGDSFNSFNRLDVFIPRNNNETDTHYFKRVNNMGIQKVKGLVIYK